MVGDMQRFWATACAMVLAGQAGSQESLTEALQGLEVFECTVENQNAMFIFKTGADGTVSFTGEPAAPVRLAEGTYTVLAEGGTFDVSAEKIFVYRDGTATEGTCQVLSDTARAVYPAVTEALLPDTGETLGAEASAAAVQLMDMQAALDGVAAELEAEKAAHKEVSDMAAGLRETLVATEAEMGDALAQIEALQGTVEDGASALTAAETERDDLAAKLAEAQAALEATMTELADVSASLEGTLSDKDKLMEDLAEEKTLSEGLQTQMAEAEEKLGTLEDLVAEGDVLSKELATTLADTQEALTARTQEHRSAAATVVSLNQKVADLGQDLRSARTATDAAETRADAAEAQIAAMRNFANAAVSRIATMQGRGMRAVRYEVCQFVQGARPTICR